jgi:pimeloyl-ACP methyl ester carboxylesterase
VNALETKTVTLHGRAVSYAQAGSGPVLLLIHGIGGTFESDWRAVIEPLAREHTVIAPDLPGHGASAQGAGDYSIGALAAGLRDLLVALGHDRATLVGHSLGGGVAMQFAYQFPEATERLVLVSSGGLGPDVNPILRAATLPGANLFLAATARPASAAGSAVARGLAAVGLKPSADIAEVARGYASLADSGRRTAFLATLRSVVGTSGQRIDAGDRLYLT